MSERISQESARLLTSLDRYTRYIRFQKQNDDFIAVICSSVSDNDLDFVRSANLSLWKFKDREKAVRSIRRLNKQVPVYVSAVELSS